MIIEKYEVLRFFNAKFGTCISTRMVKLKEEFKELIEAAEKDIFASKDNLNDFID